MNKSDIATNRLINQQIAPTKFFTPREIVHWLGAVQAQDYPMSKWAIGLRLPGSTDQVIENAINNADIIRTHILRPTWHLVAASDIRWMLQLTAPHIKRAAASMYRQLELDDKVFARVNKVVIRSLEGDRHLTRQELTGEISKAGIATNALRTAHITFQAELDGIICSGAKKGKQLTYALLDERVPQTSATLTREDALIQLASRYFTSHGPATINDFAWWSGLPMPDARLAIELIKADFMSETLEGKTYWFSNTLILDRSHTTALRLLPAFDEFMVSYKDRSASLSLEHRKTAITLNGIFKPVIVVKGKVVGLWKPSAQKGKIRFELLLFDPFCKLNERELSLAIKMYATFLDTEVEVVRSK
jgi:hypothetical protein